MDQPKAHHPPRACLDWEKNYKARVHTSEDWEKQHDNFSKLYLDDEFNLTLTDIRRAMVEKHSFYATEAQYKKKITKWKLEKNLNKETASAMIRIKDRRRRKEDKSTNFKFKGRPVADDKLERSRKRLRVGEPTPAYSLGATFEDWGWVRGYKETQKTPEPAATPSPVASEHAYNELNTFSSLSLGPQAKGTSTTEPVQSPSSGPGPGPMPNILQVLEIAKPGYRVHTGGVVDVGGVQFDIDIPPRLPPLVFQDHNVGNSAPQKGCSEAALSLGSARYTNFSRGYRMVKGSWISNDVIMSGDSPFNFNLPSEAGPEPEFSSCCGYPLRTANNVIRHFEHQHHRLLVTQVKDVIVYQNV